MNRRLFLMSLCAGMASLTTGCKPKAPYALVPVSGTVTYQGKPLDERFHVELTPSDGSRPSMCKLDAQGKFEAIHTASQKGAKPGPNKAVVYWNADPTVTPVPDEFKELFAKYGFTGSEQLSVEIKGKEKDLKIDFQ